MMVFVVVLHVIVALFMILVVLLQPGNKGGAAAALGGSGSDTVFGARGANTFLSKLTYTAAVLFMLTNFTLSFMTSSNDKSVLDNPDLVPKKEQPKEKQEKEPDVDPNLPENK